MFSHRVGLVFIAVLLLGGVASQSAFAWTSTWLAGAHSTSGKGTAGYDSVAPKVGGGMTWGTPYAFELGWVGDFSIMVPKDDKGPVDSGVIVFIGGVARKHFLASDPNVFADAELGISPRIGGLKDEVGFAVGVGAGYKFPLSGLTALSPRLGYRLYAVSGGLQRSLDLTVAFNLWN
jgi:hypothetical protein